MITDMDTATELPGDVRHGILLSHIEAGDVVEDQSSPLTQVYDMTAGGKVRVTEEFRALHRAGVAVSGSKIGERLWRTELTDVGRAAYEEVLIVEARDRIAALTVDDLTDEMIDMFICGATEPCPKCGDLILVGCGRHLAKHAEVTR